ncbi:MAG: dinitrogenase iron-molybdenum cofactor biosynthesis protein [Proteobacteria bacterium]|jgi:predicted Fe-Mo cluster-binding NifX family protein|nr:NifB/NifX family molybdenum-iron cluster-binding protein [Alphaproteobacteria bacterium]NCC04135.1 dinitrogenase iron-molybdenum cofactor biosynthesis protein [Pseudomonadota bacterium]
MKIAFSTIGKDLSAPMDLRFGRAVNYLIYDTATKTVLAIKNDYADAGQGAGIKAAETILKAGASVLVTGDCGPKAFNVLKQANVKIYSAKNVSVSEALAAFETKSLPEITTA